MPAKTRSSKYKALDTPIRDYQQQYIHPLLKHAKRSVQPRLKDRRLQLYNA